MDALLLSSELSAHTRELIFSTQALCGWAHNKPATLAAWAKSVSAFSIHMAQTTHAWNGVKHIDLIPISVYVNNSYFGFIDARLGTWYTSASKVADWIPKNELTAYWQEISRLNMRHVQDLISSANDQFLITNNQKFLSSLLEARLLAQNDRLAQRALELGLNRVW